MNFQSFMFASYTMFSFRGILLLPGHQFGIRERAVWYPVRQRYGMVWYGMVSCGYEQSDSSLE
jgi:hypothetical protein